MNKIKQGQLQYDLRECSIEDFVDTAVKRYRFINPERKINYIYDKGGNIAIIGDCEKLMQMVNAVLNNADKFSPKDKQIDIIITSTASQVKIQIKDYGSGVANSDLKKVFDGFYKGESKDSQGLGVGLLLAKHIIQFHHGSIGMKSNKSKGTTVEIKLPRLKA